MKPWCPLGTCLICVALEAGWVLRAGCWLTERRKEGP